MNYRTPALKFWTPLRKIALLLSILYIAAYWLLLLYLLYYHNCSKAAKTNIFDKIFYNAVETLQTSKHTTTIVTSNAQQIKVATSQIEDYTYYYVQRKEGLCR